MRWLLAPLVALQDARGFLFPWVPVGIACGIAIWFALPWEPGAPFYALVLAAMAVLLALRRWGPELLHPLAVGLACTALGLLAAGLRAHLQDAPVLGFRYYGPVEGRIVEIDRAQSDVLRLTLDRVVLHRVDPDRTPLRVRVSLHGDQRWLQPAPGQSVMMTAHLSAPEPPSEPGGFDFQRMAWFDRLGAVGYTRTPALALSPPAAGEQRINRLRAELSAWVQGRIAGQPGAFASGVITGDRAGITQETVVALRDSNLAHLLAISGMNMAFITGFVFAALRYGLALIPPVALRVNTKKVAAVVALAMAAFYLALSGGNVATERAFVMVAVMLGAVLLDRRALSLRSVAIAAALLLVLQPESLLAPGFQMSFAATVALIAGFAALDRQIVRERLPRWCMPLFWLVFSSVVAGLATAPLAAAHFNRFTDFGLVANLATVPAMGLLVMPGAVVALVLAPVGLAGLGFFMMDMGARWILAVAHHVAGWEGAVSGVPTPPPWVIPVMALGALWLVLWRGRARYAGLLPVMAALLVWTLAERPPLLITRDGAMVGLLGPQGRSFPAPRGAGFAVKSWLENDGDLTDQIAAADRPGFAGPKGQRSFALEGWRVVHLTGKAAPSHLTAACAAAGLVIIAAPLEGSVPAGCRVIDQTMLQATGALAVRVAADGTLRLHPARQGPRIWMGRAEARDQPPLRLARQ